MITLTSFLDYDLANQELVSIICVRNNASKVCVQVTFTLERQQLFEYTSCVIRDLNHVYQNEHGQCT